jgi:hypothetical protein
VKTSSRLTALLAFAVLFTQTATANLVQDGTFTSINYSGSLPLTGPSSSYFGQIGPDTGTAPPATGATLTVSNWTTAGYNFVYSAATADEGNSTVGPLTGQPNEAPGQFTNSAGYGNTYLWGTHNGGVKTITAPPSGGNFIAADGAYEIGAISQTITGLIVGKTYVLKFYWAGAQQQGFTGTTTEQWTVSMGTGKFAGDFSTTPVTVTSESFSGWQQATFYFYAGATTETLSFLAAGTPDGEPPFSLLAGVDLEIVPDFSNWAVFAAFGALCIGLELLRRRRRRTAELLPA